MGKIIFHTSGEANDDISLPVTLDESKNKIGLSIGSDFISYEQQEYMIEKSEEAGYIRVRLDKKRAVELGKALLRWAEEECSH